MPGSIDAAPDQPVDSPLSAHDAGPSARALFVTGFRTGCGKTLIASSIASACMDAGTVVAEWQLAPGVIVPRHGDRFGRPIPHPFDEAGFHRLVSSVGRATLLVLDGPVSLVESGDPFAASASEFLVVALPGCEGTAEAYATVKRIAAALPDAVIRVVVNRAASDAEARDAFHQIADVTARRLGRTIRSYGGLPTLAARGVSPAGATVGETVLFTRLARTLAAATHRSDAMRRSYFDEAWAYASAARGG